MKRRYHLSFKLFVNEQDARSFCSNENITGNYYKRKTYQAHYTTYECSDGWKGFICWYYY